MNVPTRVLIVEDDVATRIGLETILSAESDIEVVGHATTGLASSWDPGADSDVAPPFVDALAVSAGTVWRP